MGWHRDDGLSGGLGYYKQGAKKNKYRPALTELLEDIKKGSIQYLVVYRNDRLFRNLKLWLEILDDFLIPYNVEHISVTEPLSPLTSQGRMTSQILAAVAEQQRGWTAENIKDALRYKMELGYRAGAPPYGWKWSQERRDGHKLVERDEREGEVLVLICDLIIRGWNLSRISRELESRGIKSPSGGKKWWPDVVKRIAEELFNAGLVKQIVGDPIQGQHWNLRYFELEYHEQVRAQVKKIGRIAPTTRTSKTHLLLPKLVCAHCGRRLYVDKREDHKHRVYWCKNHSSTCGCACPGARSKIAWADAAVVGVIKILAEDDRIVADAEAVIEAELAQNFGKLKQEKAKIERDLREDTERLTDMLERLASGQIESFAYKAFEERVKDRLKERTKRLKEIDAALANIDANHQRIKEVKQTLHDFNSVWEHLTIDEQRKIVDLLIEELTLSQTHLHIKPYFAEPVDAPIPIGRFRNGKPGDPRGLSRRELAVLKMLGDGLTRKKIAERSGIALQTVYSAVNRIHSWFGVDDIGKAFELAQPVIKENGNDLPTDERLGEMRRQISDEPTSKMLEILRAVTQHPTQAEACRALDIPYNNGSQRLRALREKVDASCLDELFEISVRKGWIESVPERRETGLLFTEAEADMVRACVGAKSIAAAGRSMGLSVVAATSRMHTVYVKLGVHNLKGAMAQLQELGLDPANLPVATTVT